MINIVSDSKKYVTFSLNSYERPNLIEIYFLELFTHKSNLYCNVTRKPMSTQNCVLQLYISSSVTTAQQIVTRLYIYL